MKICVGDDFPDVTLKVMTQDGMDEISTGEILADKKAVIFGVPGAFTPTCSAAHLPSYLKQKKALKAKGVTGIFCLAVNDPFVMKAWADINDVKNRIQMLPDGNGELTQKLGLTMDGRAFGLGQRCERFAMVVDHGKVTHLWIEEPGAFEVSSAEAVLEQI